MAEEPEEQTDTLDVSPEERLKADFKEYFESLDMHSRMKVMSEVMAHSSPGTAQPLPVTQGSEQEPQVIVPSGPHTKRQSVIVVDSTVVVKPPEKPMVAIPKQEEKQSCVLDSAEMMRAYSHNFFCVMHQGTPYGHWVLTNNPRFGPISPDQAINLAAWLVQYATAAGASIAFDEIMLAIDQEIQAGRVADPKAIMNRS